jgi:hypothetical protein
MNALRGRTADEREVVVAGGRTRNLKSQFRTNLIA